MNGGGAMGTRSGGWLGGAAGLCGVLTACSGFGGANDRLPERFVGGLGSGGAGGSGADSAGSDWSCLDEPAAVTPSLSRTGNVSYSVGVSSLFGAPITNLVARACLPADPACATPISETRGLTPEGRLVVQVPVGYDGFLEVTEDGHVPAVTYMRKPVLNDTFDAIPLQPIPTAGVLQLAGLLKVEIVPDLAIVTVQIADCNDERGSGISFTNNLGGLGFYFVDGLPSVTASATDPQGLGGFANVPIRLVEVSAKVGVEGPTIDTRTVLPRVGWITNVGLRPPAAPLD
ncbi:MAG: hypothetical protein ABI895_20250 [Deltaproteobacteria bacterium]